MANKVILDDYQVQLELLERQNRRRLMAARQEHDIGHSSLETSTSMPVPSLDGDYWQVDPRLNVRQPQRDELMQIKRVGRREDLQQMAARQGQPPAKASKTFGNRAVGIRGDIDGDYLGNPPLIVTFDPVHDDIPVDPNDYDAIDQEDALIPAFNSACRHGPLSIVQFIVSPPNPTRTRCLLHHGLVVALRAGKVDIAGFLLSVGAPIIRRTAQNVLAAPVEQQLPLFELLTTHGWTVNTPGRYGAVFLPEVVNNLPLLQWFLDHGANPNFGQQRYSENIAGEPDNDSCMALEHAVSLGNVAAVRMLLDAGAVIQHGAPLHVAAGKCPSGKNPQYDLVRPSKEFDQSSIPVMALLIERGADVNQRDNSRYMVPRYAILCAVRAGAVERVKWLLEQGADPELGGPPENALSAARRNGSEEMKHVFDERMRART